MEEARAALTRAGEEGSPKKKAKKKRYEGEDLSVKQGGVFVKNRRGAQVCADYNEGRCGSMQPLLGPAPRIGLQARLTLRPHNCSGPRGHGWPLRPRPGGRRQAQTRLALPRGPILEANQRLVDSTAQSKAGPAQRAQGEREKPPTPPRPLKRQAGETAQRQHHQAGPASGATSSGEARPGGGKARNLRSTKTATTKSLVQVPPLEQTFPDYEPLARGPRKYGTWMEQPSQAYVVRPWVLVLFSGRRRKGDLANWLAHYGLIVCSLDLLCDNPCDVLDEAKCMVRDREGHTSAAGQLHLVAPSVR